MAHIDFHIVRMESDPFLPAFVFGAAHAEGAGRGGAGAGKGSIGFGDMPIADARPPQGEPQASAELAPKTHAGTNGPSIMTSPVIDLASGAASQPPQR